MSLPEIGERIPIDQIKDGYIFEIIYLTYGYSEIFTAWYSKFENCMMYFRQGRNFYETPFIATYMNTVVFKGISKKKPHWTKLRTKDKLFNSLLKGRG